MMNGSKQELVSSEQPAAEFDAAAVLELDSQVEVRPTRVGRGVFAKRSFPATSVIGEIVGDVIDDDQYGSEYCICLDDGRVMEPFEPFRLLNHRCEPNCEFDWFDMVSECGDYVERRVFVIALRDIQAGEELTIDYNWCETDAIRCCCDAANCRGWVVGEEYLDRIDPLVD